MTIKRLQVKNFRSLHDVEWRPQNLNVLIGPNASGKSNLLAMLELLSISAQGRLGEYVQRQGGMDVLSWDGTQDDIEFALDVVPRPGENTDAKEGTRYRFALARMGRSGASCVKEERVALLSSDGECESGDLEEKESTVELAPTSAPEASFPSEETALSSPRSKFELGAVGLAPYYLRDDMSGWGIYRNFDTSQVAPVRQATITRFEKQVSWNGDNLVSVLHTLYTEDRDFRDTVNDYMHVAFGEDFEELVFRPAADQRVQLALRWRGLDRIRSAADLSDGTLRFLYLLAILEAPEVPSLIAIEEPDVGLHPSMLGAVAEIAAAASERTQVVLTTHSTDFLDAFDDLPTVTVVANKEGKTQLKVVEGDELKHWAKSYQSLGQFHRTGAAESLV